MDAASLYGSCLYIDDVTRTMRWQHAVIWRLEQKPRTQLCFFAICVGLVSADERVRVIATPSLRKIAPKEAAPKLAKDHNWSTRTPGPGPA